MEQRPSQGLLANMWQFPNFEGHLTMADLAERYGTERVKALESSSHVFSHIEWEMIGFEVFVDETVQGYLWLSADEILNNKAVPAAFRCYTNYLNQIRFEEI